MSKLRVTNKWVKENYKIRINCNDLKLLNYLDHAVFYNCGVYGWNYDLFVHDNIALIQGYRNMPTNFYPDYRIKEKYNKLIEDYRKVENSYYKIENKAINLLDEFIKEATTTTYYL